MKPKTMVASASMILVLSLVAACYGSHDVADSPEARQEEARTFARLSMQGGSLDDVLDKGAEVGAAYSLQTMQVELGRELSDEERARVRGIMRDALAEFITPEAWTETLVAVCVEYFTASELREINDFFQSSTGSKFLSVESKLSQEINDRADAIFEENIYAFITRVDEELGEAFPELADEEGP